MPKKNLCLECREPVIGRADKKFCSDDCRSAYHNRLNSDHSSLIRNINNTLRKNRRILAALNPNGKSKVHRNELLQKGFNFNYFTNTYITKTGNTYYFCYDQGYLAIEGGYYTLVVGQEYVD